MSTVLLMYHGRRIRREIGAVLAGRYEVIAAHGAAAAERLLQTRRPHVILVEQARHNGSAGALMARLAAGHPLMPVVALSRSESSHGAMAVRGLGACAVVRWPGQVKRLLAAIARAVSRIGTTSGSPA